jgi:hypothetical protein
MQDLKATIKQIVIDTLDDLEIGQTIYYGLVISNDDPMNLGRVRITPKNWVVSSYKNAYEVDVKDQWTNKDPFVFLPLLPIFLYQVPKIDEWCHVIFYNDSYTDRNKYYIQGGFSSINNIFSEPFNSSTQNTALGERTRPKQNLSQNNLIKNPQNKDLYPDTTTIGLLGRYNSDILLPEGGYIARVNKIGNTSDINPIFNKRYSFSMLQNYKTKKVDNGNRTFLENTEINQNIQYLIEYNVFGGLGSTNGSFSGYINVYKISPYRPVNTSNITESTYNTIPNESKIGPIYREDYTFASFEEICSGFRSVIQKMNSSSLIVGNNVISQPFPFIFQPELSFFEKFNPGTTLTTSNPTEQNSTSFILNTYLNQLTNGRGFGLVSSKDKLGKSTELTRTTINDKSESPTNVTYGINVADKQFFLTHDSTIQEFKIDFQNASYSGNVLDQNFIINDILPNTNSMVRGEKLLELLDLIVKFLINHVHPYHGMPPVNTSIDGTTTEKLLGEMLNAYNNVLNENLRIN